MQTIGPLCVEVAGIKDLQSLLSLSWAVVIIPSIGIYIQPTLVKFQYMTPYSIRGNCAQA